MIVAANKEIDSDKIIVKDLFGKDMWYRIPDYQRPYVWDDEQVQNLLDDVAYAAQNTPDSQYFLGSIVFHSSLASTDNIIYQENNILDGQQRLTTLYLIMAVIRDLATDDIRKKTCAESIYQQANRDDNIPERLRIVYDIRQEVHDFVDEYIKPNCGTLKIDELKYKANKAEDISVRNMANAIIKIREWFEDPNNLNMDDFFPFLRNKVLLIYVASKELDDAFRLFTVLNDRGMKLRNSDILKAENLREVSLETERKQYARIWEEIEGELNDDFDQFLSYIRTILVKEKARLGLLKEFEVNVYNPKSSNKLSLLNKGKATFELIKKYKEHYDAIFSGNNYNLNNNWDFDNLVTIMNDTMLADLWIPPLLAYRNSFGDYRIVDFLKKLDNKVSGDWIAGESPTFRIESMNDIIKKIEQISMFFDKIKEIKVNELLDSNVFNFNKVEFFRQLSNENIYGRRFTRYILYKLDFIYGSSNERKSTISKISVEHILPQNPDVTSNWVKDFTKQERDEWLHKLGNLILISRPKNSSLGRLNYQDKVKRYFGNNIETFAYSVKVLHSNTEWKLKNLIDNHNKSINAVKSYYDIKDTDIGFLFKVSKKQQNNTTNSKQSLNEKTGYCIRCGVELKYNPNYPFCINCYRVWNKNCDSKEKFCHSCGSEYSTTFHIPFCTECNKRT